MTTLLTILAAWLLVDAVLVAAWIGFRVVADRHHHHRAVVYADIGGQRFVVPDHPALRKSA